MLIFSLANNRLILDIRTKENLQSIESNEEGQILF